MKGVVLFADDDIHDSKGAEHKLYQLFRNDYVVLTVDNLKHLDHALKSISNFDVIILDWEFIEKDPEFAEIKTKKNPLEVLKPLKLFSKIFVYSNSIIADTDKGKLESWFPGRVEFKQKNIRADQLDEMELEYIAIKAILDDFSEKTQSLEFTLAWTRAINQSLQGIFSELSDAHRSWLKVLYETSTNDKGDAVLEVIQLMNNLLAEELVQDANLRQAIIEQSDSTIVPANPDQGAAKLFRRIYYTAISNPDVPIMTGDIFDMSEKEYGILITPECDVYTFNKTTGTTSLKNRLELLVFDKESLLLEFPNPKPSEKGQLQKFNQDEQAKHILPSFPYLNEPRLLPAVITFKAALRSVPSRALEKKVRRYKLNSPYIQQLRQRFSTAHSRVGVPAVNKLVREFNLSQAKEYKDSLVVPTAPPDNIITKAAKETKAKGKPRAAHYSITSEPEPLRPKLTEQEGPNKAVALIAAIALLDKQSENKPEQPTDLTKETAPPLAQPTIVEQTQKPTDSSPTEQKGNE